MTHSHPQQHDVLIAGAGSTGLMLAAELALADIDVAVVERRADQTIVGQRALGLHARTLEVFAQRGVVDRFLAEGRAVQNASFASVVLDLADFPSRTPHGLALAQAHVERILAGWVAELPVTFYRGRDLVSFTQDDAGVDVVLDAGGALRARYLVGCDGGRSLVRKQAGIDFPGWDASTSYLNAELSMTEEPPFGVRHDDKGTYAIGKPEDPTRVRVVLREEEPTHSAEPTFADVRALLLRLYGSDFGAHDPLWISRFSDMSRQAAAYRKGRVLLAGDAAHVHSPMGGQGLNLGVQDAVNLGWKLAQVVRGDSPDSLLDTYQSERHPVAARAIKLTMSHTALSRGDARTAALNETLADLVKLAEPRKRLGGLISGLEIHYDLGEGHPLLGRRVPDLDLESDGGPVRLFTLLHAAKPVLLNLGFRGELAIEPWSDRVRVVDARHAGSWEIPVLGEVSAPTALLIRPDGYVAWVGDGTDRGLREALTTWFGLPR